MLNQKEILDFGLDFNFDIPEEQDDVFRIIKPEDYVPEWESEVQRYMVVSGNLPTNTIFYKHVEEPRNLSKLDFLLWAKEEVRRCKEGHNGMCGKMYFYFNYCWIEAGSKKIRPQYRVVDNEWFKLVEACQKSNEWGIICVKRRRVGASWKEASDVLHDCIFNTFFKVGMNSKTQIDSELLFQKVKFQYENLPAFLRVPTTKSNTKDHLTFAYVIKDEYGNKTTRGNQSTIMAKAPTDNAYEGMALNKWICDEGGKIKNLATIWQYTEDCLMKETRRIGVPIIFGTAGDILAEGKDLEYMWRNAVQYKLKKFFFSGWMGLTSDEYGNDNKEAGIRWIVYERHRKEGLRAEELNTFIQKYPLTVPEAFTVTTAAGVGNIIKIKSQQQSLRDNPPKKFHGWFRLTAAGESEWVPDPKGKCILYEHPKQGFDGLYIAGCDPADHNEVFDEPSDLSMFILMKQSGTDKPHIVFEYTDRPKDVTEYYEQAAMAASYYNRCKILIERNRYMMIDYLEKTRYKYILARTPVGIARVHNGRTTTYGVQMTPAQKEYLKNLIAKYVEDNYEFIPSYDLLDEFLYFGVRNTDKAMAFGIALMHLADSDQQPYAAKTMISRMPHFGFRKDSNGNIQRVNYKISPPAR